MYKNNNKSKKTQCANPVFESWIQDWKDDATAKELQSRFTYTKCLNSLRKYPLPLKTGKECIILEGFGDKICKWIDEKLKTFISEGGVLHESDGDDYPGYADTNDYGHQQQASSKPNAKRKPKTKGIISNPNSDLVYLDSESSAGDNSDDEECRPPVSKHLKQIQTEKSTTSSASGSSKLLMMKHKSKNTTSSKPSKPSKSSKKDASRQLNDESDENDESCSTQNKKKSNTTAQPAQSKRGKDYVPEFRSGAYAILVTLYNHEIENPECKYMLKNQLIKEAQKQCDTMFTSSDPNNYYTAWSSMSTLIKKELAVKENKLPARYHLTDTGRQLACKIQYRISDNDDEKSENETPAPAKPTTKKKSPDYENYGYSDHEKSPVKTKSSFVSSYKETSPVAKASTSKKNSHYVSFVNSDNEVETYETQENNNDNDNFYNYNDNYTDNYFNVDDEVQTVAITTAKTFIAVDDDDILLDSDSKETNTVVTKSFSDKHSVDFSSKKTKTLDECIELIESDSNDSDIIQLDDDEPKQKSTVVKKHLTNENANKPATAVSKKYFDDEDDLLPELDIVTSKPKADKKRNQVATKPKVDDDDDCLQNSSDAEEATRNAKSVSKPKEKIKKHGSVDSSNRLESDYLGSKSSGLTQDFSANKLSKQISSVSSNGDLGTSQAASVLKPTSSSAENSRPPTVISKFSPGNYDIMLYVDNCENAHAKGQEVLINELKSSDIKYDYGKLNVGDFTWIARSRTGESKDLILNYIVERKRLDDLVQSIIDGRYKEQKFRLRKCGITNVIYLIEDFGSMKHMSLPAKSILQADVNTLLIDELIVHHTSDPKESAYYLIGLTHYIIEKYKNVTLNECIKSELDEYNESQPAQSSRVYLMNFVEFNQFSNKNKPLTVKEMFAKCLMKIQGVSQEKAIAIVKVYPTPALLFNAYAECSNEAARTKLLANLKFGSSQRNIGPVISKIVADLFCTETALS